MNLALLFRHEPELQNLSAGEVLFKEGDHGDLMYILMSGLAEIIVKGKVMEKIGEGSILGEMAMIDDGGRSATVVAISDCKLATVDRNRFNFLVQQTPNFALYVMRVMADRLRKTDEQL
jgi:CRP-like cAMP-binding protein